MGGNLAGLVTVLPFVHRRALSLGVFVGCSLAFGLLSWATWRYALRRVMTPPPTNAVVAPGRFASRRLLISFAMTLATVVLSVVTRSPGLLGISFGGGLGMVWAARKMGQFERNDGRRLLRTQRRGLGSAVSLYAGP